MTYRLGYDFQVIIFYPNVQIIFPLWRDDKYSQLASLEGLLLWRHPALSWGTDPHSGTFCVLQTANEEEVCQQSASNSCLKVSGKGRFILTS